MAFRSCLKRTIRPPFETGRQHHAPRNHQGQKAHRRILRGRRFRGRGRGPCSGSGSCATGNKSPGTHPTPARSPSGSWDTRPPATSPATRPPASTVSRVFHATLATAPGSVRGGLPVLPHPDICRGSTRRRLHPAAASAPPVPTSPHPLGRASCGVSRPRRGCRGRAPVFVRTAQLWRWTRPQP